MIDGSQGRPEFIQHARNLKPSVTASPRHHGSSRVDYLIDPRSVEILLLGGSQGHNLIVGPQVHAIGASLQAPRFGEQIIFMEEVR